MEDARATAETLKPYIPRLIFDWGREAPGANHRRVTGTVAFVDISGFTKMTERLARRGKEGAEEVNDVLNLCFTRLLDAAYDHGGSVLKWGGDAVVLLFTDDDHAARACRAAFGMRKTLRQFGRLSTSAGLIQLRMSVGIHSGEFDFYLAGGSHRELLVTGPAASCAVRMEQVATAGEIALSTATAALLPDAVLGAVRGEARLLRSEPRAAVHLAEAIPEINDVDPSEFVPRTLRSHLLAGGGDTEHRKVVVAFVQFRGTDAMTLQEGPQAVADALDRLVRSVQSAVDEHGVAFLATDVDNDGGKIILVAGAPEASGDEEALMLRALRSIVDASGPLAVRIGVNAGPVVAGDFGPSYRRTYTIIGDAVNLAARIMGKAEPGQILSTATVLDRSRTEFESAPLEPFLVKGKRHPVEAFAVGPPIGARKGSDARDIPLVGRDRELTELRVLFSRAATGSGRLVELVGEPGLGKSRLLHEFLSGVSDTRTILASCDPYESSTPYHPFRDLLRDVVGLPARVDPEEGGRLLADRIAAIDDTLRPWIPLLAVPMDLRVPNTESVDQLELEFKKVRLEQVTCRLLSTLLPSPTVFVFEDTHWMDESSGDLLRRLVDEAAGHPWLICVTRRDVGAGFAAGPGAAVTSIRIEPLTGADMAAFIGAASGEAALPRHVVAMLTERSGGNPLFLQELVAASRVVGGVDELPHTVEGLLAAQIDRISASDRQILRQASVLGASFPRALLEDALGAEVPSVLDPTTWIRLKDFLDRNDDEVRFRHALIRDAAYAGLPYRRRRELHRKVGDLIEQEAGSRPEDQAELLSMHFLAAHVHEKAWRYSRLAGTRAQDKFAHVQAATFYRRALDAARARPEIATPADLIDVCAALGDVSERAGLYSDAAVAYRSARRYVDGDRLAEAPLLLKEGIVRDRSGRWLQAMTWYRRALRAVEDIADLRAAAIRGQASVWYASIRRQQGKLAEAERWSNVAIKEAEAAGEKEALAHAHRLLFLISSELGQDGEPHANKALTLYENLGDQAGRSTVLNDMGRQAGLNGRWDEAVSLYEASYEARLKTGDEVQALVASANIAEIRIDQGRFDEAEAMLREVLDVWRPAGFTIGIAFATSYLGKAAARSGRHDEAQELLDRAGAIFREMKAEAFALEVDARRAENQLRAGDLPRAFEEANTALAAAEMLGGLLPHRAALFRIRGYSTWALHGDRIEAQRSFEESLKLARSVNADYEVALSLDALARLETARGEPEGASMLAESRAILDRLGVISVGVMLLPEAPVPEVTLA